MDIFAALSTPSRVSIIEVLAASGELASSEIADRFEISAPAISQHLKVLTEADLVRVERRAQQRIYRLNPEKLTQLEDWARLMRDLWNARFDRLGRAIAEDMTVQRQRKDDRE